MTTKALLFQKRKTVQFILNRFPQKSFKKMNLNRSADLVQPLQNLFTQRLCFWRKGSNQRSILIE